MAIKNYYKILEVPETASAEDIKKAFRRLSKIHHPDKGGNEDSFKEINEAYSVLGDADKKGKYDSGGYDQIYGNPSSAPGVDMNDIFNQFFGRGQQHFHNKGGDLRANIRLTLYEIFTGVEKKIKYRRDVICTVCNGTGAANASDVHICPDCKGTGFIQRMKNTIAGAFVSREQCATCKGSGKITKSVCQACGGRKVVPKEETVDLTIPRSVRNGDVLSFAGAGHASAQGGITGSLIVVIEEERSEFVARQESELYTRAEIGIYDAIFGKSLEVKTIENSTIKLNIAPGTQSGTRLRIEGKGLYKLGTDYRGDMFIDVSVLIPKNLTEEEKEIFEKLKDFENFKSKDKK